MESHVNQEENSTQVEELDKGNGLNASLEYLGLINWLCELRKEDNCELTHEIGDSHHQRNEYGHLIHIEEVFEPLVLTASVRIFYPGNVKPEVLDRTPVKKAEQVVAEAIVTIVNLLQFS